MTWDPNDRAIFTYGPEVQAGEAPRVVDESAPIPSSLNPAAGLAGSRNSSALPATQSVQ